METYLVQATSTYLILAIKVFKDITIIAYKMDLNSLRHATCNGNMVTTPVGVVYRTIKHCLKNKP